MDNALDLLLGTYPSWSRAVVRVALGISLPNQAAPPPVPTPAASPAASPTASPQASATSTKKSKKKK